MEICTNRLLSLKFGVLLGLGAWDFELPWCLERDFWSFDGCFSYFGKLENYGSLLAARRAAAAFAVSAAAWAVASRTSLSFLCADKRSSSVAPPFS